MKRNLVYGVLVIVLGLAASVTQAHADRSAQPARGPASDASTGLIAYWRMDEGSGDVVVDSSGHGHDLRFANNTAAPHFSADVPPEIGSGNSVYFDGSGQYAYTFPLTETSDSSQMTLEFWVEFDAPFDRGMVIAANVVSNQVAQWAINADPQGIYATVWADNCCSPSSASAVVPGGLVDGQWYHVAMVFDGSGATPDDRLKVYVDGQHLASTYGGSPVPSVLSATMPVPRMGAEPSAGPGLKGKLDEMRIYNIARSDSDIAADHAGQVAPVQSPPAAQPDPLPVAGNAIAYWKMDEGIGTTIVDSSGHGHDLRLTDGNATPLWSSDKPTLTGGNSSALQFDGFDDYAYTFPLTETSGSPQLTVESWVKFDGPDNAGGDLIDDVVGNQVAQWAIGADNGEIATTIWIDNCCNYATAHTVGVHWITGQWYHLGLVFDGTATGNANRLKIYVDGVEYPTYFTYFDVPSVLPSTLPVPRLGLEPSAGVGLKGELDDVRIYTVARSSTDIRNDAGGQVSEVFASPSAQPTPTPVPGNPVVYWKMEEGAGTTVADSSGHGHTLNLGLGTSAPQWTSTDKPTLQGGNNFALAFDGTDDYGSGGTVTETSGSTQLTVESWVEFDDSQSGAIVDDVQSNQVAQWALHAGQPSPDLSAVIWTDSCCNYAKAQVVGVDIMTGQWYHIAMVFDGNGTTNAERMKVYVDGVLYPAYFPTGDMPTRLSSTTPELRLGYEPSAGPAHNGKLDEVRIYTVARSSTDIANDANGQVPTAQPPAVDAGGPYTVTLGSAVTLTASASSPQGGPYTFAWDLDNNETFETVGQNVSYATNPLTVPGAITVSVVATDSVGLTGTAQALVNVVSDPSLGLVAYWNMEAGAGTVITDSSGHGHDLYLGNYDGQPSWITDTPTLNTSNGYALSLNTNDYTYGFPITQTAGSTQVTFEGWYKFSQADFNCCNTEWNMFSASGQWTIAMRGDEREIIVGFGFSGETVGARIQPNQWYHIAYVFDGNGATNADRLKIFVNGIAYPVNFGGSAPSQFVTSQSPINNRFPGAMDEVRIYTIARSATDIALDAAGATAPTLPGPVRIVPGPVAGDPVGYWKMEAGAGKVITDSSGLGHDLYLGNANGQPSWTTDSPTLNTGNAYALSLDVNDYTYGFPITQSAGTTQVTFEGWYKFSQADFNCCNTEWKMFSSSGQWTIAMRGDEREIIVGFGFSGETVGVNVQPNQWYHIAFVFDGNGATNADRLKIFVNGVAYPVNFGVSIVPNQFASSLTAIGNRFPGEMDEVRIYTVARSSTDIANDAAGAIAPTRPAPVRILPGQVSGDPVAYWKMEEGSGTTVVDSSGHGHDLYLGTNDGQPSWITDTPTLSTSNGYALSLDTNDYTYAFPITQTAGSTQLTFEGWYKFPAADFNCCYTEWNMFGSSGQWEIAMRGDEREIIVGFGSSGETVGVNVQPDQWYHIAFVFDGNGATNADRFKIFVNGVAYPVNVGTTVPLQFPAGQAQVGNGFPGEMDEVRIYTVARSSTDMALDAAGAVPHINLTPLVNAGGPYTVTEGSAITLTASASSPQGGPYAFAWDLDSNGSFETAGQSVSFATNPLTVPGTITVSVIATDSVGLTGTAQALVNVVSDPSVGLLAYWKMDEGFDNSVFDSSGHGYTLSLSVPTGTPAWSSDTQTLSVANPADLSFDGTGRYAYSFPLTQTSGTAQLTVEAWVRFRGGLGNRESIAGAYKLGTATQWWFGTGDVAANELLVVLPTGISYGELPGNFPNAETVGANLQVNHWYHVAFVYNGSGATNADRVQVYVNGHQLALSFNPSRPIPAALTNAPPVRLGNNTFGSLNGDLDEVRIYNVARKSGDIAFDAGGQTAPVQPAPSAPQTAQPSNNPPIAYWKMEEGSGSQVVDASGHGYDLRLGSDSVMPAWISATHPFTSSTNNAALAFDGAGDYAYSWPITQTSGASHLSVESLVYLRGGAASRQSFLGAYNLGTATQWWFGTGDEWGSELLVVLPSSISMGEAPSLYADAETVGVNLQPNRWYHVAFAYDGSGATNADRLKVYVDGVQYPLSYNAFRPIPPHLTGAPPVRLGSETIGYFASLLNGYLDEVRIYDSTRNATDIATDAVTTLPVVNPNPLPPPPPTTSTPALAYWKMEEGAGAVVADSSGHGNSLALDVGSPASAWITDTPTLLETNRYALGFAGNGAFGYALPITQTAGASQLTVEGWVKFQHGLASRESIMGAYSLGSVSQWWIGTGDEYGSELLVIVPNAISMGESPANHADAETVGVNLQPDRWYHIALVYDGSAPSYTRAKVFVNGVEYPLSFNAFHPMQATLAGGSAVKLGSTSIGYFASVLDGNLDEVRVYNTARTSTDIALDAAGHTPTQTPPVLSTGGPYAVNEGGSVTVTASATSTQPGPLTYAWDLDHNGSFETSGQSPIFSALALDGPSTRMVSVVVTDSAGLTATAQATVTVLNVPPTAVFGNNALPGGLVARWPADGNTLDVVGGNNATLQNGATYAAGHTGQAFSLDGVDDFIDLGPNNIIGSGNAPFSVAWWMYASQAQSGSYFFTVRLKQDTQFFVGITHDFRVGGDYIVPTFRGASSQWTTPFDTSVLYNHWAHLAVIYNGGDKSSAASYQVYLNGVLLPTGTIDLGSVGGGCNDNAFGSDTSTPCRVSDSYFFQGLLDELQVYNRALSPSEVQTVYNSGGSSLSAGTINEGGVVTATFSSQFDPSTADTAAGFRYAYNCNGGSLAAATYATGVLSASTACPYTDNGNYTITGRILDKDGGFNDYQTFVSVTNVAPTAVLRNSGPIAAGNSVTVTLSNQFDPSSNDTAAGFHYAYSCLSASLTGATYATSVPSVSATCTFTTSGLYSVTGRIIDKDNGFSDYRTEVSVIPAPPSDITAPVVVVTLPSPVFGQNGWFNAQDAAPIVGTASANDTTTGGSNITAISCTGATHGPITGLGTPTASASLTVSAQQGVNQISCGATDSAGNTGASGTTYTATLRIDTIAPTITVTATNADNSAYITGTWTNQTVTVRFTCGDAAGGSGVASCPAPVVLSSDGVTPSVTGTVTDTAGNTASVAFGPIQIDQTTVILKLLDSTGHGLAGGTAQYFQGGWQTITGTTDINGVLVTIIPKTSGNLKFRMIYANASLDKTQNVSTNSIVVFQTVKVVVKLQDHNANPLDTGVADFNSGGWISIGSTTGGQVSKELLPGTYNFRMTYLNDSITKSQDVGANPTVVFQTVQVVVKLQDHNANPLDPGTAEFNAGGWQAIGGTSGGQVSKELLPDTYNFRMTYLGDAVTKSQNVGTNAVVVFQTVSVVIQLKDHNGNPLDTGAVQVNLGGWQAIGNTAGGQISKELLPDSYSFRMTYAADAVTKSQNVGTNAVVVFQTVNVVVQLKDHNGNPLDTGAVDYNPGSWINIGNTSGGQISKELLPDTYNFRMTYAGNAVTKSQNVSTNATVVFQTVNVVVQLKDHAGGALNGGVVEVNSGGWQTIGTTVGGQVSKELLPDTYSFRMTWAFDKLTKSQNVGTNATVVFQTGQVHSDSGKATDYNTGTWHAFTQDMELLPNPTLFRFSDGTANITYTLAAGVVNHIH